MKLKFLYTAMFICLATILTLVGIWAVTDLDFALGGDITYTAPEPEPVTPEEVSYLTFEYYDDLTAKLMSILSSAPEVVEIPSQISKDGKTYTVTKIAEGEYDGMEWEAISYASGIDLIIPDSVTEIGQYAFAYCTFGKVTIGTGLQSASAAFDRASIETLIFKNGIKKIPDSFSCEGRFSNVIIPDSVIEIGGWTFSCNYSLTSIEIPENITSIGYNAFESCGNLSEIYVKAVTPPQLGEYAFNAVSATIYVPTVSVDAYKSADGWSDYVDYIVGYDF